MASVGGDAVPHNKPADPNECRSPATGPESSPSDGAITSSLSAKQKLARKSNSKQANDVNGAFDANKRASRASVNQGPTARKMKRILDNRIFKAVSMVALIIALFGGCIFILCDIPDDPGTITQDVLMILVLVFFLAELVLRCIAESRSYPLSFFFWMDSMGTISMLFEISFVFGSHGKIDNKDQNVNTLLLRAARASKVGARAGRFSKVVKVLNFLHKQDVNELKGPTNEARVLNAKLMMVLSSKVAMLTIALVMGVPLLNIGRFPVDDLSLRAWSRTLEDEYAQAYTRLEKDKLLMTDGKFLSTSEEFRDFYKDLWYMPYRMDGYSSGLLIDGKKKTIPGRSVVDSPEPNRKDFIVRQTVSRCRVVRPECDGDTKASLMFNFGQSKKFEAGMDIAMIVFVVLVMALESADLSQTLDRMVVKPVERMLGTVRMMAKVLSLVTDVSDAAADDSDFEEDIEAVVQKAASPVVTEAELLATVFSKLAKLTAVFMQSSIVDEAEISTMDYESQGVLLDIMRMEQEEQRVTGGPGQAAHDRGPVVTNLAIPPASIESWELNMLEIAREVQTQVATYITFDSSVGRLTGANFIEPEVYSTFFAAARTGYLQNPYHNFIHACDVVAVVFRILIMVRGIEWLSDVDMCAMLIAALCHDIGHGGKTNPFLLETSHELAMRYNDKSPLENFHCSKLFEICKDPLTNVFGKFSKEAYRQARKVCIQTILHTDNALHFDMVKDVKKAYEMASDICDTQARDLKSFKEDYKTEVLLKDPTLWLKLILHIADISTPLKPFWISKQWATRVQDEFFAQGDEEKRLGIPVGMLNDRDKVNRSGSEHGFISFLVSPLIFAAVGCFPTLHPLASQMVTNMQEWRKLWVETGPSQEDIKKREDDIQKIKDIVDQLKDRKQLGTVRTVPGK